MAASKKKHASKKVECMTLQFRGVNELAFVNHKYAATVYLMKGSKLITGVPVMLEVELLYEDGTPARDTVLCLESKDLHLGKRRPHLQLSYHFKESSLFHDNRKFLLRVRPKQKIPGLLPAVTKPISVIKYKLEITNALPAEFFKDQGGRDKHMQLKVRLTDAAGKSVGLSKSMPLVAQLCYEKSHRLVPNQADILKLMDNSMPEIGTNGRAEISFRIEEVSSRHQRQNFILYVAPDVERCPLNGDVRAAYSSGVTVRSKLAGPANRKRTRKRQFPKPGISPEIGKCLEEALVASKRARVATSDPKQATQKLIQWATRTCDMLRSIQSQHIGYDLNSDGSPNMQLKIHRCPSCYLSSSSQQNNHTSDCTLNKILSMYTESVGPGIACILKSMTDDQKLIGAEQKTVSRGSENMDRKRDPVPPPVEQFNTAHSKQDPVPPPPIERFSSEHSLSGISLHGCQPSPVPLLLERFSSQNSVSEIWRDTHPSLMDVESLLESEQMIHYVYMKYFHNDATNLGFPAFDKNLKLKGFFQENAAGLHDSAGYLPLSSLNVKASKVDEVQKEFADKMSTKKPNSNNLIKCLRNYKDLLHMKEDVCKSCSAHPLHLNYTTK